MNLKWTIYLVAALILSASFDFALHAADPKPAGESQFITNTRQLIYEVCVKCRRLEQPQP